MMDKLNNISNIVKIALLEDIGSGDVTSDTIIPEDEIKQGEWIAKEDGVIAGLEIVREVFKQLDSKTVITFFVKDGDAVLKGQSLGKITGRGRVLLSGERVALNFMQRMSGIASATRKLVEKVEGTGTVILDTRKTVPGLRYLDKLAVKTGGGQNHRFGLFDMVLIKDNHIAAAGTITNAVQLVRNNDEQNRPIEVEVKNLDELKETLPLNVDRILLDNMSPIEMRQAVVIAAGQTPLEASGNVSLRTVREIAETGVDYISVGGLTHSVQALDISFLF